MLKVYIIPLIKDKKERRKKKEEERLSSSYAIQPAFLYRTMCIERRTTAMRVFKTRQLAIDVGTRARDDPGLARQRKARR